jgi:two-component system response regulator ResD
MRDVTGPRILLVDDEAMVLEVLCRYLEREGYAVATAADGAAALAAYDEHHPDLVLLDLMLPGVDGLEVLRRIRTDGAPPVIVLSAKGEEADRVVGLELGADDYVTKPFSPREVVARVRAVLRRAATPVPAPGEPVLRFGDLAIDGARREVRRDGRTVPLTRREYDLLSALASRPGRVLTRLQLLETVWDTSWSGSAGTVNVHMRRLREKIEHDPSAPRHLTTVWGVGYRFDP